MSTVGPFRACYTRSLGCLTLLTYNHHRQFSSLGQPWQIDPRLIFCVRFTATRGRHERVFRILQFTMHRGRRRVTSLNLRRLVPPQKFNVRTNKRSSIWPVLRYEFEDFSFERGIGSYQSCQFIVPSCYRSLHGYANRIDMKLDTFRSQVARTLSLETYQETMRQLSNDCATYAILSIGWHT